MYKIYINENCLVFADQNEVESLGDQNVTVLPFLAGKKMLLNYADKLEKSPGPSTFVLLSSNPKSLFDDFRSLYKQIKAAGGIIFNEEGAILFIERLGRWDLPKGKVDTGEKIRNAAIREVKEETGLDCQISGRAGITWHTYFDARNRRILKKTVWYTMALSGSPIVIIQEEENITGYRWLKPEPFLNSDLPTYRSIRAIVREVAVSSTN
jgi:8-oxo-dGTP pyrophosphatase MutT (NUDIX family)